MLELSRGRSIPLEGLLVVASRIQFDFCNALDAPAPVQSSIDVIRDYNASLVADPREDPALVGPTKDAKVLVRDWLQSCGLSVPESDL